MLILISIEQTLGESNLLERSWTIAHIVRRNARIQGMGVDLDLIGNYRFNWALTIFYFSYIVVEIPSNILLKKIGGR